MIIRKAIPFITAAVFLTSCGQAEKPKIDQNSPVPKELTADSSDTDSVLDKPVSAEPADEKYQPLNYDTQKAVWISYIDLAKMLADTEQGFRENISQAFKNVSDLGCNTVYVHVRAFGDAYYISELYVPSKYIPDEEGTIRYDPLAVMTEIAHEYELSFHAWINPLRCDTDVYMQKMEGTQIYEWYSDPEKYPEYVTRPDRDDYYWLNPACPEVRSLIADGAAEIAEKYEVDGIHIDDYFYPTTDESFDGDTYVAANVDISLSDWRLDNCSEMVGEIYSAVKSVDEDILFGVSPQGNIDNNYSQMYADVRKWCAESGYLDYIAPQIYFGYNNTVCPFTETLGKWEDMVTGNDVKLVCGLGVYKLDSENEFIYNDGIIAEQIEDILSDSGCGGFALYSYDGLFVKTDDRFIREREKIAGILD